MGPELKERRGEAQLTLELVRFPATTSVPQTATSAFEIDHRTQAPQQKLHQPRADYIVGKPPVRTTRTHRFSYLIVHLPFSGLPDLLIRPEGVFDKMAGAFGFDDIDFE